jgi:hypothetical protein
MLSKSNNNYSCKKFEQYITKTNTKLDKYKMKTTMTNSRLYKSNAEKLPNIT